MDRSDALMRTLTALQIGMNATSGLRGGVDRYYFNLLRELPARGISAHGLVVGNVESLATEDAGSIESFAADEATWFERWRGLRGAVSRAMPGMDVVVSHFAPHTFPVLDRIRSRPLVVHFHGPWALESAVEGANAFNVSAKRLIERAVYRGGSRVIVLSHAFARIAEREYGVPEESIRIVPGGVDIDRFRLSGSREEARRILGWQVDRPTIVTVRRLVRAKGLENLIDASVSIRDAVPDVAVKIVGTGPLASDLQKRVVERGLERTVAFAGFVPDEQLPLAYRAADLFVVPTIALEGFGLVVVEALACGTPVLVTPVAGLPEVVSDLDPALVLASTDARDIAAGVIDALKGRLVLPTPEACIDYAKGFDWPAIAGRVRDVYCEVA